MDYQQVASLLSLVFVTLACLNPLSEGASSLSGILKSIDKDDLLNRFQTSQTSAPGTTLNIKEIVIGRCWNYQRVTGLKGAKPDSPVACENVWQDFAGAFANKDPCETPDDAYDNFVNSMAVNLPKDSTLFWSGSKALAMMFSKVSGGTRFSLEKTFLGQTVDDLQWCGTTSGSTDGMNYDQCPPFNDLSCRSSTTKIFWGAASIAFARQATGSVSVLLNGSHPKGAFRNDSFFSTVELPNLNTANVDVVNIIVVHDLDGKVVDNCDTGSVLTLKSHLLDRGLKWTCVDDPQLATLIQCSEAPENSKCKLASSRASSTKQYISYVNIWSVAIALCTCIVKSG